MKHLAKSVHDVTLDIIETWCGEWDHGRETEEIDKCDCRTCLQKAAEYGTDAERRLKELEARAKRG